MGEEDREIRFQASERAGEVGALLSRPRGARWLLVLGHGAGAGMRHPFMESASRELAARGVATFRYQFPYMEKGKGRPDPGPMLQATVAAAVTAARGAVRGLPLLAGGKSMSGRMTSLAAAAGKLPDVRGLVYFGFPLHAAGKPSADRGAHLTDVGVPQLFLQGTRDRLADLTLLRPLLRGVGTSARMLVFEDADHSFHVPKRSGRTDAEVLAEAAEAVAAWAAEVT